MTLYILPILILAATSLPAAAIDITTGTKPHNVTAEPAEYKGRKALKVVEAGKAGEDRLVLLPAVAFQNGTIEAEISGDAAASAAAQGARGFVGIAFRIAPDASKFECFYLRPTNGRADDQVRRNHSAQYIAFPDYPWHRLRKEFPEKYESYVDLVPGEWTKVKIEVNGTTAKLYVHGAAQPTLVVNDLKLGNSKGAIGLWIGPGTIAHFSNVRVTP